jgi:hypothetical protein
MKKLTYYGFQIEWYNRSDMSLLFDEWCQKEDKKLTRMYKIYSDSFDKMEKIFTK